MSGRDLSRLLRSRNFWSTELRFSKTNHPFISGFAGDTELWLINPEAGDGVDDKYIINGNGGSDFFDHLGGTSPDNDKFEIENFEKVRIIDGDGDDEYVIKGSSGDHVEYFDGPGDDELEFEG